MLHQDPFYDVMVKGLRLASRWLLTLLCGLKLHGIALWSSPALCGSVTLLTMLSAICIRTVETSSSALAVQHNETPAEAPPHLLPCYSAMTFAPCLQSYSTGFFKKKNYWRMHHKLAVTRKPIYCMFTVSLTSHERRLLSSRKMYIFAEGTNWLFFFFNLPPSLHQCLIGIQERWHPSPPPFFFTAALMFLPLFIPCNSYIWAAKPRGHKQPVAQINLLLEKKRISKATATTSP